VGRLLGVLTGFQENLALLDSKRYAYCTALYRATGQGWRVRIVRQVGGTYRHPASCTYLPSVIAQGILCNDAAEPRSTYSHAWLPRQVRGDSTNLMPVMQVRPVADAVESQLELLLLHSETLQPITPWNFSMIPSLHPFPARMAPELASANSVHCQREHVLTPWRVQGLFCDKPHLSATRHWIRRGSSGSAHEHSWTTPIAEHMPSGITIEVGTARCHGAPSRSIIYHG